MNFWKVAHFLGITNYSVNWVIFLISETSRTEMNRILLKLTFKPANKLFSIRQNVRQSLNKLNFLWKSLQGYDYGMNIIIAWLKILEYTQNWIKIYENIKSIRGGLAILVLYFELQQTIFFVNDVKMCQILKPNFQTWDANFHPGII